MDTLKSFLSSLLNRVPDVIFAILLLVVAFIAAKIAQKLVTKLLGLIKGEKITEKTGMKQESVDSAKAFIAKLVYFVVFLLFLPGVLDKLGMNSVSAPIENLANTFLNFIPKLIAAAIIIVVGFFIAKILKDLLLPLVKATKVDKLQEKTGVQATEKTTFSNIIVNVIYGLVILFVVTAALEQLGIAAISNPASQIVSAIFAIIPNILGAIVIIAVGIFIAGLVAGLLENLLAGVGADTLVEKVTGTPSKKLVLSKVIAQAVKYILVVIFLVQGVNVLELPVLTEIGAIVLGYVPAAVSAILIIAIGIFAGNTAESAISKKFPEAKGGALIAKIAIYVVTGFLCLSQLGVATVIVESTFIFIIAAVCIAFAIAFGIGGRTFAANTLEKVEKKINDNENK
ncbi:MAG: mechanosensitive ion channel [Oscillospiraceae bacterium]|nr:mechanosensitive ion channel [Oscillospiraceae bacterium]